MPETTETTVEAVLPETRIEFGRTGAVVVTSLAIYGAGSLIHDVTGKVNAFRAKRKAAKAVAEAVEAKEPRRSEK
jgi:hypothetical protein